MPVENGFVPTPAPVADYAASVAFGAERPSEVEGGGRLLLPGLGQGNLYDAVRRYCTEGENWKNPEFDYPVPECVGVESDPERLAEFRERHTDAEITLVESDFLLDPPEGRFDWVLANPPYTRYKRIPEPKREEYRDRFDLARGQFPLYAPFFEQALRLLKPGGWLTFILPFSALTTGVTKPLREVIRGNFAGPIMYLPEETFDVQVETILLGLQKKRDDSGDYLWLEELYGYETRPILERLGVEEVEDAANEYYERFKKKRTLVNNRDNWERSNRDESANRTIRQAGIQEFA
ncbi:Eco57I restriction-modification methylase domain-containing protein [Halorhabdus rudnickae]|uniref:Eco57I restriction-modification methylase domain-containing protein n=1 Tax=Halorhabdus rudnickae TaxID=1775544 RepID=UPI0010839593|nr:N-6 DNA methylase [Halorhabdus rudnickae]